MEGVRPHGHSPWVHPCTRSKFLFFFKLCTVFLSSEVYKGNSIHNTKDFIKKKVCARHVLICKRWLKQLQMLYCLHFFKLRDLINEPIFLSVHQFQCQNFIHIYDYIKIICNSPLSITQNIKKLFCS